MAYTEIHAIKATVNKAIDYICDPEKTAERFLVSSFACAPETAAIDFAYTLDHCRSNGPNQAYHLIQSFLPGEVSYEEAHSIGVELADKILEGKYAYVVSTHIDKEHCHNHIIFCAADHIHFDKYHACKKNYYRIRNLSDELCREHHLSVIEPGEKRGHRNYKFKPKERAHEELIDINQERFAANPGLKRWATVENLKNIAESYHAAGSITELEQKLKEISTEKSSAKSRLLQIEKKVKQLQEILKYANQYYSALSTYQSYKKAKNPDAYFQKHESEIILYGGAKRMLEQAGINVKNIDVEKLKAELLRLESQKKEHSSTYKMLAKNEKELQKQIQKLSTYINTEREQSHEKKQEQKQENHSL